MSRQHTYSVDTTFNIVATYFTNILYNDLYANAVQFQQQRGNVSVTDAYSIMLMNYDKAIKSTTHKKRFLQTSISGIRAEFDRWTSLSLDTTDDCYKKLINAFIPEDFMQFINMTNMQTIIYNCLVNCISAVINEITSHHIGAIVSDHSNTANAQTVQSIFAENCAIERENLIARFTKNKTSEGAPPIEADVVRKIRSINAKLEKQLEKSAARIEHYKERFAEAQDENRDLANKVLQLEAINKQLHEKNKSYAAKILPLIRKIKSLEMEYVDSIAIPKPQTRLFIDYSPDAEDGEIDLESSSAIVEQSDFDSTNIEDTVESTPEPKYDPESEHDPEHDMPPPPSKPRKKTRNLIDIESDGEEDTSFNSLDGFFSTED